MSPLANLPLREYRSYDVFHPTARARRGRALLAIRISTSY